METSSFVIQKFINDRSDFAKVADEEEMRRDEDSMQSHDNDQRSTLDYQNDYRNFLPIKRRLALRAARSPSMCASDSDSYPSSVESLHSPSSPRSPHSPSPSSPRSPGSHISDDSGIETTDQESEHDVHGVQALKTHPVTQEKTTTALEHSYKAAAPATSFRCRWLDCTVTFDLLDDLVNHVNEAHVRADRDAADFRCLWDGCLRHGKGFNARYKMLIHIRTHTNEKPYSCELCNKSFSRLENLKIHNRSHTGERPYICPFEGCNKAYSNSSDRFKHVRTHQEQKPYVCRKPGCSKRYTDPSSLRKHIKTHGHFYPKDGDEPRAKRVALSENSVQECCKQEIGKERKTAGGSTLEGIASDVKPVMSGAPLMPTQPTVWNSSWSANKLSQALEEYCRQKYLKQSAGVWPVAHPLLTHPLSFYPSLVPNMFSSPSLDETLLNPLVASPARLTAGPTYH